MPRVYIPQHLRRLVLERARECCEYCMVSQLTHAGAQIVGITAIGHASVRLLRLNDPARVAYRQALIEAELYPPPEFK